MLVDVNPCTAHTIGGGDNVDTDMIKTSHFRVGSRLIATRSEIPSGGERTTSILVSTFCYSVASARTVF